MPRLTKAHRYCLRRIAVFSLWRWLEQVSASISLDRNPTTRCLLLYVLRLTATPVSHAESRYRERLGGVRGALWLRNPPCLCTLGSPASQMALSRLISFMLMHQQPSRAQHVPFPGDSGTES